MRKQHLSNKAGVSLITVLMFMLIATIAATATWKFISSEGFSSASRMLKREAYQSAQAGIENARSWMTFNANEVGALIRQFKDDGKPINLDNQLRNLQKYGQNYHVWLTGVNTEGSTYKLKIVSSGEARNNTHHTEAAIFRVDGLYRVKLPVTQSSHSFAEAFHGELKTIDKLNIDKAVITQTPEVKNSGGQALNDITVTEYLILDGSFYANDRNSIKDLYVSGGAGSCSGINVSGNMYVGGVFYTGNVESKIDGSLYTEGGINLRDTYPYTAVTGGCYSKTVGSATVKGNITSNGPFIYYDANGSNTFTAKGHVVINDSIRFPVNYPGHQVQDRVRFEHNVYVKSDSKGSMGDPSITKYCADWNQNCVDGRDAVPRTKMGSGPNDKIWLKGFEAYLKGPASASFSTCNNAATTKCEKEGFTCARSLGRTKWIGFKGTFLSTEPSADDMADWNANKLDKYKQKLEDRDENCNKARTPIQINKKIFELGLTHSKNKPMDCNPKIWSEWDNTSAMMNACYQTAKEKHQLYSNSWLILEFDTPVGWQKGFMSEDLKGNFIFKFNAKSGSAHQVNLPITAGNSKVLLYLPDGWPGKDDDIEFVDKSGVYRYFVYGEGNVKRFDMRDLETPMSGSVVMANCASFNTDGNNSLIARFDQELTDDLADASIICDNDGSNICSGMAGDGSSSSSADEDEGYDRYYISMAPQIGVSLESQGKSFENVEKLQEANGSNKLDSSFIILPRVISLPSDPYGTLGDYINVIALNSKAPLTKAQLSLASPCTKVNGYTTLDIASLSSKMFSPTGNKLPKGNFRCEIEAEGYNKKVPIFVSVDNDELRNLHQVSFVEQAHEMRPSSTRDIYVRLSPNITKIDLKITCPAAPSNWQYEGILGNVTPGGTCIFKDLSNTHSTDKLIKLFTIKTDAAESGTMTFQILDGNDYIVSSPSISTAFISYVASLSRESIFSTQVDSICNVTPDICPSEDERPNWPDCELNDDVKWVEPDGTGFKTEILNDSWLVTTGMNSTAKLIDVSKELGCIVLIPQETCSFTENQQSCVLHASAKKKVNRIKFKFENVESGKNPFFTVTRGDDLKTCNYDDNDEHECIVNVYADAMVSMNIDKSYSDNKNFKYWKCDGPHCPGEHWNSETTDPFTLQDNETVISVMFNEVDKHCFFDKFQSKATACQDFPEDEKKEYCIDNCAPDDQCSSASATVSKFPDAKWHLVRGTMDMIDYGNGIITVFKNSDVTIMSTVNAAAGTHGTLKALVRLPKDSKESGFLLGANAEATSYITLNAFIDNYGYANVRICNVSANTCREEALPLHVTEEDMVMIEAEISANDITITLFKGNESTKTTTKFDLGIWADDLKGPHVGFRIASPKFKVYGIGWKSQNYDCIDTYPTIKCSFSAVSQYGVIPSVMYIKPWVGYSGWSGWNKNDCTELYHYKGDDACDADNSGYTTCDSKGFWFNETSSGKHGYTDNEGNDVYTAKVSLDCGNSSNTEANMWATDSAHCGVFWTGPQYVCSTVESLKGEVSLDPSEEQSVTFSRAINMRSAKIKVDVENPNGSELWGWLYSEGKNDELYPSEHVFMTNESRTFDITEFDTEATGFDISKVKKVHFENKGSSTVTVKSVTSICETAVRIKSCKAEEKVKESGFPWPFFGGNWGGSQTTSYIEITANINNRDGVDSYLVTAQRGLEQKTYEISRSDISVYGNETAVITIPKEISGLWNQWNYTLKLKADGSDYFDAVSCTGGNTSFTPACNIEKPGDNLEIPQNSIEFRSTLDNCMGCTYEVAIDGLDNQPIISGTCSNNGFPPVVPPVVPTVPQQMQPIALQRCYINIAKNDMPTLEAGKSYNIRLYSPDNKFTECQSTFTVAEGSGPHDNLEISSCTVEKVDGTTITIKTKAKGCPKKEDCKYEINPASVDGSGNYKDNDQIQFSYGGDEKNHTITITKGTQIPVTCHFSVSSSSESSSSSEISSSSESSSSSVSSSSSAKSSSSVSSSSSAKSSSSVSSSSAKSSSSGNALNCNDGNSTVLVNDQLVDTQAGECIKYTMTKSQSLKIGCWWAPARPVSITLTNCDGTTTTISHPCDNWVRVQPKGICTIYLKPEKPLNWKLNDENW